MATRIVYRSNGDEVHLVMDEVIRQKGRAVKVIIAIPAYNARFIFVLGPNGQVKLADRRKIDIGQEAVAHVSRSVYAGLAGWAGAILKEKRI